MRVARDELKIPKFWDEWIPFEKLLLIDKRFMSQLIVFQLFSEKSIAPVFSNKPGLNMDFKACNVAKVTNLTKWDIF